MTDTELGLARGRVSSTEVGVMRLLTQVGKVAFGLCVCITFAACHPRSAGRTEQKGPSAPSSKQIVGTPQIIGEGTDFLTVQIEVQGVAAGPAIASALVLDREGHPLRKVTGFSARPEPAAAGRLWFYFCLYAPSRLPPRLLESSQIRFQIDARGQAAEQVFPYLKRWGGEGGPKTVDLPAPPNVIAGRLVLKDYTFLAAGDPRAPEGYYVEGKIHGADGRWSAFQVSSGILGSEPEPEVRLESDRGWLELSTGRAHSMPEAVSPVRPYVEGWWDGKGFFHPNARLIVR
jgi:hypothetical protein